MIKATDIKLIASDLDGTLLNPESELNNKFFAVFRELNRRGIQFIAASGRQYYNLLGIFAPVKDEIIFMAENGAYTVRGNEELLVVDLNPSEIRELIVSIRQIPGTDMILCGKTQAYVESDNTAFLEQAHKYYTRCEKVDDLLQVSGDRFLKIAVCDLMGANDHSFPMLQTLGTRYQVTLSGKIWVDISDKNANKGHALQQIQNILNIAPSETMVFGDYMNDLEMMKYASFSYAMDNAIDEIKQAARFRAPDNSHDGVIQVLEKLIGELQTGKTKIR